MNKGDRRLGKSFPQLVQDRSGSGRHVKIVVITIVTAGYTYSVRGERFTEGRRTDITLQSG